MKLCLIFLPVNVRENATTTKAQDDTVGFMPPLSLAYVAAIAMAAGHKAEIIDAVAERLNIEQIAGRIKDFSPDLLGVTITTYGIHQALNGIKAVKERVNLPVIVGGWHLSLYPEETMAQAVIDYAVIGEADHTLPEFLGAFERGGDLNKVAGLAFKRNNAVVINRPRLTLPDIDATPFPARHLLKNGLYHNILTRRKNFTVLLSSRGCPYRCIFCDLKTVKFRQRSAVNFVDEVEECYRKYGVREMDIYDSAFTINRNRLLEICALMVKRGLDMSWTVRARADCVDEESLLALKKAGCNTIMYGIESGSPEILKRLRKDTDLERIKNAVAFTGKCGIKSLGFFIVGSPGETRESVRKTLDFARGLPLDYVHVTRMIPFPNTEVYEMYMKEHKEDFWRRFTKDPCFRKEFPSVATEITAKEAMRYVRAFYRGFYFRPKYLIRALMRMGSWFEFRNSVRAALRIMFDKS